MENQDLNEIEKNNPPFSFFDIIKNKTTQKVLLAVIMFGITASLAVVANNVYNENLAKKVIQANPFKKTTYKDVLPPSFPETISIATSSKLAQSYSKEYTDKMSQSSVVVSSPMSVLENFHYYESVLEKDGWKIVTKQDNEKKSLLFGLKASSSLEIIIRDNVSTTTSPITSYVIINSYKK